MAWKEEILEKVKQQEERNAAIVAAIPEKYRCYLLDIEKGSQISKKEMSLDKDLTAIGCYVSGGKTYLPLKSAYFTVMGKIAQFNDWVNENSYSAKVSDAKFVKVGNLDGLIKTITVTNSQGKMIREVSQLATIGKSNFGVDATNALENAETSAIGRALNIIGLGTQLENILSADAMLDAELREILPDITEEKPGLTRELFIVDNVKDFTKNGSPVAKMAVTSKESGEQLSVWLKDNCASDAKLTLVSGDAIEAVMAEIPGTDGKPVSTFLEFKKVS
jgi:hypothetical protein